MTETDAEKEASAKRLETARAISFYQGTMIYNSSVACCANCKKSPAWCLDRCMQQQPDEAMPFKNTPEFFDAIIPWLADSPEYVPAIFQPWWGKQ